LTGNYSPRGWWPIHIAAAAARPRTYEPIRVEGGRELGVAISDQDAGPLLLIGQSHDQVARLFGDPGAVWVRGDADEIDAATFALDEEEHMQASQQKRLDSEEVTLKDPGGLPAEELRPAQARSSRCGLDAVAAKDVPDAAGRQRDAEPDQLAVDPLVPPARVLRREAQDELSRRRRQWRPARRPRVRPATADKLAMPA
jgi:hypothetical protein